MNRRAMLLALSIFAMTTPALADVPPNTERARPDSPPSDALTCTTRPRAGGVPAPIAAMPRPTSNWWWLASWTAWSSSASACTGPAVTWPRCAHCASVAPRASVASACASRSIAATTVGGSRPARRGT